MTEPRASIDPQCWCGSPLRDRGQTARSARQLWCPQCGCSRTPRATHVHHFSTRALVSLLDRDGLHAMRIGHFSFEHGLLGGMQSIYNLAFPYNRFFRAIVLNSSTRPLLAAWPELLAFPMVLLIGGLAFVVEALAGSGALIRVSGRFEPVGVERGDV